MKKLKNNRLKTKNLLLSEHTLISTDFFFSVVVSVGLGMAWLLIANAQLIVKESMIREQSHVAKGGDILLERRVKNLAKGFPLEHMASYISEQNEDTAAFLSPDLLWALQRKRVIGGSECLRKKEKIVTIIGGIEGRVKI